MSGDTAVHTAVVFVHGLLERRPTDILDAFAKTVVPPREDGWEFYPRPIEVTETYEARRYAVPGVGADLFEYDWSFLATSTRYAGFVPALLRLIVRRPSNVPDQLFGIWRLAWLMVLVPTAVLVALFVVGGYFLHTGIPGWILGVVSSVVVLSIAVAVFRTLPRVLSRSFLTTGFVNVARYFDPLPESRVARRAIRGGLVDLLHTLHQGGYARVVVVGHGVGGFIAYDALITLWAETYELHAGPSAGLQSLNRMEKAADRMTAEPAAAGALNEFRTAQFDLWQDLRSQGNPWLITDFVTVGTPMAIADLIVARPPILAGLGSIDARHELFDRLTRRAVMLRCPPRPENRSVDDVGDGPASYGRGAMLGAQSLFAVTRWTNLWFPVDRGSVRGDWFGGPLRPLFGPGILDITVSGNLPARLRPGAAHMRYFAQPQGAESADGEEEEDVADLLRAVLALGDHRGLDVSMGAPQPDPATLSRVAYRSGQRSM